MPGNEMQEPSDDCCWESKGRHTHFHFPLSLSIPIDFTRATTGLGDRIVTEWKERTGRQRGSNHSRDGIFLGQKSQPQTQSRTHAAGAGMRTTTGSTVQFYLLLFFPSFIRETKKSCMRKQGRTGDSNMHVKCDSVHLLLPHQGLDQRLTHRQNINTRTHGSQSQDPRRHRHQALSESVFCSFAFASAHQLSHRLHSSCVWSAILQANTIFLPGKRRQASFSLPEKVVKKETSSCLKLKTRSSSCSAS